MLPDRIYGAGRFEKFRQSELRTPPQRNFFMERGVGEDDHALETLLIIRWRPRTVGRVHEFERSLQTPQKPREA